jgi:hypothetical protein
MRAQRFVRYYVYVCVCSGTGSRCFALGSFCVSWTVEGDSVTFDIKGQTNGYVSFGFPEQPGTMAPADAIVCYVTEAGGKAFDGFMDEYEAPEVIEPQDLQLLSAREADGVTECSVRRKLTTADPKDRDVSLSGLEIIWALGPTDDLYSQHDRKGSGRLVLTR